MQIQKRFLLSLFVCLSFVRSTAQTNIYVNEIAYDFNQPKKAIVGTNKTLPNGTHFQLVDSLSKVVFESALGASQDVKDWKTGQQYYVVDFSNYNQKGSYKVQTIVDGKKVQSPRFQIGKDALSLTTLPSIAHYYRKQRANTSTEWKADKAVKIGSSQRTADLRGGWCDASGDVSKYFSHLAYTNFMPPQQTGMVTWSMINAVERIPKLLDQVNTKDSLLQEALWGADYMMRALSDSGFFYQVVFSFFKKDPSFRRAVGLEANSVTTDQYQCAFREGAGMAIAALARISTWKKNGDHTSSQYLNSAEHAFQHLLKYNTQYADDHKENILDDYCALMAATELWIATEKELYKTEARKRAANLSNSLSDKGYFIADGKSYIYWHASDAGLPIIALARYLDKEQDKVLRAKALYTIKKAVDYNLDVTYGKVANPFGYARQTFNVNGTPQDGFFIPHENVSGWWWQGENARIASLATAVLTGSKLVYGDKKDSQKRAFARNYASQQLSWILGCNPYAMCFMYGFGNKNVPYMSSNYGHGSERGGVSNGVTGKEKDGSGIMFLTEDNGNEWRWTEQWIPHAAYFLQALTALGE